MADANRREPSWRERLAHHEAGHAVVAYLLRVPFTRVSIVKDTADGSLGRVHLPFLGKHRPDLEIGRRTKSWLRRRICVSLAGATAEHILLGDRRRIPGTDADLGHALDLACYLAGDIEEVQALLSEFDPWTGELLRATVHWKAVKALAGALLKDCVIGSRQARAIIREHVRTRPSGAI